MTLKDLYNWYSELETVTVKKNCLETLRVLRQYINRLGNPDVKNVTLQFIVQDRLNRLKNAKPGTTNIEVSSLREMLNNAVLHGKTTKNPIRDLKLLPTKNVREVHLKQTDVVKLMKHAPDWLVHLILIAAHMPMRREEIIGLTWQEIDFNAGENGSLRLSGSRTKNAKGRAIPLHPKVRELLQRLTSRFKNGFVFEDQKMIASKFDYEFRKCRESAGLPNIRYHDLRHLCISEMFKAGIPQYTIMKLAGHSSDAMFRRYMYLDDEELFNLKWA